ncbi:MAG: CZB domain-containing protein [Phycisphaerales bacterium]|nr:CZB domain-containing protein [Phycisphaerales bacterium]
MVTCDGFDFSGAKKKHLTWKMKIRAFLDGKRTMLQGEALSHNECELGQWLFSVGLRMLGKNPLMVELDQKHQKLHALVKQILDLKFAGKVEESEEAYAVLLQTSDRIVSLLDELEVSTKRKAA